MRKNPSWRCAPSCLVVRGAMGLSCACDWGPRGSISLAWRPATPSVTVLGPIPRCGRQERPGCLGPLESASSCRAPQVALNLVRIRGWAFVVQATPTLVMASGEPRCSLHRATRRSRSSGSRGILAPRGRSRERPKSIRRGRLRGASKEASWLGNPRLLTTRSVEFLRRAYRSGPLVRQSVRHRACGACGQEDTYTHTHDRFRLGGVVMSKHVSSPQRVPRPRLG